MLIEAPGKMIWQIRSKKEAGIEFVGLPGPARDALRRWIAEERSRQGEIEERPSSDSRNTRPEPIPKRETSRDAQVAGDSRRKETSPAIDSASQGPDSGRSNEANQADPRQADPYPGPGRADRQPSPPPRDRAPSVTPMRRGVPPRWRSEPGGAARAGAEDGSDFREQPYAERIPAMPHWNGYMAPGVGMEFRKRRPWWTYTAAIGILAAIGFAALMMFNPDAITRARVDTLVHTPSSPDNSQPADQNNANQPNAPQANANGASASNAQTASPTQPALPQTPTPNNAGQGAAQNAQPNSAAASVPNGATNPSDSSDAAQQTVPPNSSEAQANLPGQRSSSRRPLANAPSGQHKNPGAASSNSRYESSGQPAVRQSGRREYAYNGDNERNNPPSSGYNPAPKPTPTNQGNSAVRSAQPATNPPSGSYGNTSASNRAQPSGSNAGTQQASRSAASQQSPIDAYRAQTAAPSTPNSASTRTNQPAQQNPTNIQHSNPQYRSLPQSNANVSRPAAPEPQVGVVEMSGYQSVAVPTSMPLSGVPSGSVGATSQLHAIRVPSSLQWARQFLPGNLGVGRLLSSYSPAYPTEAAREGIQGSVKLDVIVGTDGTIRSVSVLSGPPMLSHAAVSAVRDWRYAETFLAGEPIETEHYVVMVFRLASGN